MDNKKIDGIKKLSKKELERSRKIILDVIGENKKNYQSSNNLLNTKTLLSGRRISSAPKRMNNFSKKESSKKTAAKIKNINLKKNKWQQKLKKTIKPIDSIHKIKSELSPDFLINAHTGHGLKKNKKTKVFPISQKRSSRQAETRKKSVSKEKILKSKIRDREKEEKAKAAKRQQEEKAKAAKRQQEEKAKAAKRQQEEKEKEEAKEKRKILKAKKRAEEKKARQDRYKKIKNNINAFWQLVKKNISTTGYFFSVFLLSVFIFYLLFVVLLLKFNIDIKLTRQLQKFIPVPAVITNDGIIDYYFYKDLIKDNNNPIKTIGLNLVAKKLLKKYGLPTGNIFMNKKLMAELKEKAAHDPEINQVGINRIEKIKELIVKNKNFTSIVDKYGDKQAVLNIGPNNEAAYSFSEKIKKLTVGEISDIITTADGYYIFRAYRKTRETLSLNYVFVKAKPIEKYLNETADKLKIWKLVR